jgi:hypothetical protein
MVGFKKINWKYLTVITIFTSLVLDLVYHYVLGTSLVLVGISMLVFLGFSLFIPLGQTLPGYAVKFGIFILYGILVCIVPNLFLEGVLGQISWVILLGVVTKAIVSVLLCFVFDIIWDRFRKREDGTKLRLK